MKYRYFLPFLSAALLMFSSPAFANTPEGTAHILKTPADVASVMDEEDEESYSAFSSSGSGNTSSTSTMYFNDETGALISFEVTTNGSKADITIRKNGAVALHETVPDTGNTVNITRHTFNGSTYFLVKLAHHTLHAYSTPDGSWHMDSQQFKDGNDSIVML